MKTCYSRTKSGPYIAANTVHAKNYTLQIHVVSQPLIAFVVKYLKLLRRFLYDLPCILTIQSHKAIKPSMNYNQRSTCPNNE